MVKLEKIAREKKLQLLGKNEFDSSIYYLSCTKESAGNALEMANYMYESGAFEYATPEFIIEARTCSGVPNDPYFKYQWNLQNSRKYGIDIGYVSAMNDYTFPNLRNIIVAVVDTGIYGDYPDLPLHSTSYDAHTGTSSSRIYGDHGTQVASVLGATSNNGIGIAGVASGVKIMPISICPKDEANKLGIKESTATNYANAFRFAANNGAHVINNSWSFGIKTPVPEVNKAIEYAIGKGCVVVFCSGNGDKNHVALDHLPQPVAGLGWVAEGVLSVGAITSEGKRWESSDYGTMLDVVAPGDYIWTIDRERNYEEYKGTSFAAPHVSGIAALIFAEYPDITYDQVIEAIEGSAKKVGGYPYYEASGRYNGRWNEEMGYGLVDAHKALQLAKKLITPPSVAKPDLDIIKRAMSPGGFAEFSISNYNPDATYEWDLIHGTEMWASDNFIYVYCPREPFPGDYSYYLIVRCRASLNGYTTDWSQQAYLFLDYFLDQQYRNQID